MLPQYGPHDSEAVRDNLNSRIVLRHHNVKVHTHEKNMYIKVSEIYAHRFSEMMFRLRGIVLHFGYCLPFRELMRATASINTTGIISPQKKKKNTSAKYVPLRKKYTIYVTFHKPCAVSGSWLLMAKHAARFERGGEGRLASCAPAQPTTTNRKHPGKKKKTQNGHRGVIMRHGVTGNIFLQGHHPIPGGKASAPPFPLRASRESRFRRSSLP